MSAPASIAALPGAVDTSEEELLGVLLMDGRCLAKAQPFRPDDFHHPARAAIARAVVAVAAAGQVVALPTVRARIEQAGEVDRLRSVGGLAYLAKLIGCVVTTETVAWHARQVREHAARRRALEVLHREKRALESGEELTECFGRLERDAQELSAKLAPPRRLHLVELCDGITEASIAATKEPLPIGVDALDAQLGGGLFPGEVTILQAATGQGKTTWSLAAQCAGVAADPQRSGLYASTEMRVEELQARRACQVLNEQSIRVTWRDVMRGLPSLEQIRQATRGTRVHVLQLRPHPSAVEEVGKAARELAERFGKPPLIVADYLQGFSLGADEKERRVAVGVAAYEFQALAVELNTPVILISSIGRAGSSRDKRESDDPYDFVSLGKESGEIEYAGANVLHLDVKPDEDPDGWRDARVIVAKSRFGRLGIVGLRFHGASGRFVADMAAALSDYDREVLAVIDKGTLASANQVAEKMGKNAPKVKRAVSKLLHLGAIRKISGYLVAVSER